MEFYSDFSQLKYVFADVINDVQVKNNNRITKETIITFGGIELGKDYSDEQLNKILLDAHTFVSNKYSVKRHVENIEKIYFKL